MEANKIIVGITVIFPCLLLWKIYEARRERRSQHLPPGPKRSRLPYLGNKFDMPDTTTGAKPWLVFDQWAKQYGTLVLSFHHFIPALIPIRFIQATSCHSSFLDKSRLS